MRRKASFKISRYSKLTRVVLRCERVPHDGKLADGALSARRSCEVPNRTREQVAELESAVLPVSPGTLDYQLAEPSRFALTEIGLDDGRVVGFLDMRAEESHPFSLRISVALDSRGQGLGGISSASDEVRKECHPRPKVRARLNDADGSCS